MTAVNPATGQHVPVWAADYVLADYGTGAIVAVPAHDQRDLDFAKRFELPVRRVLDHREENPEDTYVDTAGNGRYVNSGPLDGLADKATGIARVIERLEADDRGIGAVNFRASGLAGAVAAAAVLGLLDSDRALPVVRCPTTSCPSWCRTSRVPNSSPQAAHAWRRRPTG